MKVIRIVVQGLEKSIYQKGHSHNISIPNDLNAYDVEEITNIIVNALSRYGIQHKYIFRNGKPSLHEDGDEF